MQIAVPCVGLALETLHDVQHILRRHHKCGQVARNKLLGKEVLMNEHWWGELKLGNLKHMETFWNYTDPDNASERLKPLRKKPR